MKFELEKLEDKDMQQDTYRLVIRDDFTHEVLDIIECQSPRVLINKITAEIMGEDYWIRKVR